MNSIPPISILLQNGFSAHYFVFSALERYFRRRPGPSLFIRTNASLIDLARLFEDLQYPDLPRVHAAVERNNKTYCFYSVEKPGEKDSEPFSVLDFLYDIGKDVFLDPNGVYKNLKQKPLRLQHGNFSPLLPLIDSAKLISHFPYTAPDTNFRDEVAQCGLSPIVQQDLLLEILRGAHPERGLQLLYDNGFVEKFWSELFALSSVNHDKDFHPEGNGWQHTLETMHYRKERTTLLSLSLLLHDTGKHEAQGKGDTPFENHSHLGVKTATRFLRRLGFAEDFIRDVCFLVKNHMLPQALGKLPVYRIEKIMDSPLFPQLLEVYRADTCASFMDQESYYEACRHYRAYLKNKRNPFRKNDGSKTGVISRRFT